ncbi:Cystatin [Giardia duodenalis]|uniref:Cystatin n=1 Tax=Giardia intestinalis (strain ATCC 50803 / WB clone C6) TaxID=184922 RepID=A8BPS7_GIAIC|nr:Cystatin [Giardia intestinalis]KAE8304357.1 Cystatin [Giardia intestinalis]|eukprot:XP_001705664.1 Hypothetical protein GL50803_27918 [Giardia lamblia ATCC 50803]
MLAGGWTELAPADVNSKVREAAAAKIAESVSGATIAEVIKASSQVVRGVNTMLLTRLSTGAHYIVVVWFDLKNYIVTTLKEYTGNLANFTWPMRE